MVRIYGGWQREVSAQDVISLVIVQRNKNIFFAISLSFRPTRSLACSQFNSLVCLRWIKCATKRTREELQERKQSYERKPTKEKPEKEYERERERKKKKKRRSDEKETHHCRERIDVVRGSSFFISTTLAASTINNASRIGHRRKRRVMRFSKSAGKLEASRRVYVIIENYISCGKRTGKGNERSLLLRTVPSR